MQCVPHPPESENLLNEQSSGGPLRFCEVQIRGRSLAAVPNFSCCHLHPPSAGRRPVPRQGPRFPQSRHHGFHRLTHSPPLLCKDAAQGCNKIHTKVIFHREKELRNNCSSDAQQASDSWRGGRGARRPGDVQLRLGRFGHCSKGGGPLGLPIAGLVFFFLR